MFNVLVSYSRADKHLKSPVLARLEISGSLFGQALEVSQQTDLDRFVFGKTRSLGCPTSRLSEKKNERAVDGVVFAKLDLRALLQIQDHRYCLCRRGQSMLQAWL